jgi:alpha-L-fucosidase
MNTRLFTIIGAFLLLAPLVTTMGAEPPRQADTRMDRFREAKFGMFIHWGLYAIPARGEWVMNRSKLPVAEYAKFAGQFNPVKFNADEWVRVAKDAGMKYMVITSKHHDGFAMFGSTTSPYNIVDATPFKRDPLKELAAACQKAGIGLGFYYSQAQDWHHPGGAASGGRWDAAQAGNFDDYLKTIAMPQVKELLTGYGPVFSIWFDTPVQMTRQGAEDFTRLVHATQPATFVNSRIFYSGRKISTLDAAHLAELKQIGVDYLSYGDRQIPGRPQWRDWETCMTLNNSWGFNKSDDNWKSPAVLVAQLVEIASKGGNFLLNVGPTAEGEIPEPSVRNLKAVGDWLRVNGEAIYGAEPSPLVAHTGGGQKPAWRCTSTNRKLYVHLLQWPEGELRIAGVDGKVTKAYLLADPNKRLLPIKQAGPEVTVNLPENAPGALVNVLCLTSESQNTE